jgi:BMFP domain-containing protein YqiC
MATPKKSAGKKASKKTAKKATSKKTAKKASARASEPSMRSAAAKAREAAGDVQYVVKKQVQELLKNLDMRTDSELVHEVNARVREMLTSAADRAKRNDRKTVRPHDL